MSVKYYKQEVADLRGDGQTNSYYRIKLNGMVTWDELVQHVVRHDGYLDEGDVTKVVQAVVKCMAEMLADGQSVTVDGLGRFKPVIGFKEGMERDEDTVDVARPNARSFEVNRIRFHAEPKFVRRVAEKCHLERGGETRLYTSKHTKEERLALALKFLESHPYMRVGDYMELTGLSKTAASTELRSFRNDPQSGIAAEGKRASLIYIRKSN